MAEKMVALRIYFDPSSRKLYKSYWGLRAKGERNVAPDAGLLKNIETSGRII